jgi:hypothetical protein
MISSRKYTKRTRERAQSSPIQHRPVQVYPGAVSSTSAPRVLPCWPFITKLLPTFKEINRNLSKGNYRTCVYSFAGETKRVCYNASPNYIPCPLDSNSNNTMALGLRSAADKYSSDRVFQLY